MNHSSNSANNPSCQECVKRLYCQQSYRVSCLLGESQSLSDATTNTMEAIGKCLGWELGVYWALDEQGVVLRCTALWQAPHLREVAAEFVKDSLQRTFARGEGLPGRVWATGVPVWIPDISLDINFPRGPSAKSASLCGAFAFPVTADDAFYGVIEFFCQKFHEPDEDLLNMVADFGGKIGLFDLPPLNQASDGVRLAG